MIGTLSPVTGVLGRLCDTPHRVGAHAVDLRAFRELAGESATSYFCTREEIQSMKPPFRIAFVFACLSVLASSFARGQQEADCLYSIQNGDSLGFWSPHENALMNVSRDAKVQLRGTADAWSLFYVWTHDWYTGNGPFKADLQARMIGNTVDGGHLGASENPSGYKEMANNSWGQSVLLQITDSSCNLTFSDYDGGVMGPNEGDGNWMESRQSNNVLQLAFRYRASVSPGNDFTLGFGDVELYSKVNYQGQAWVLHLNGPAAILNNFPRVPFLNDAVESIRFGRLNGKSIAGIVASTDAGGQGASAAIAYDVPDLSQDPRQEVRAQFNATSSVAIYLLPDFVKQTKSCINCDLTGWESYRFSFQNADLRGAVFDGMNLSDTSFAGPKTNLTHASLRGAYLNQTSFANANLTGAFLDGDALIHADLTGATLVGASMQCVGAPKKCANLSNMDLTVLCGTGGLKDANLTGADLSAVTMTCPGNHLFPMDDSTLVETDLSHATLNIDLLDATLSQAKFDSSKLGSSRFPGAIINCSSFRQVDLSQVYLGGASFSSPLSACGTLTRTDFSRATLTFSANLSLNGIPPVVWSKQLILDNATLGGALCVPAWENSNLSAAQLEGIKIHNCKYLTGVIFKGADLINADFSGSTLKDSHFENAHLSGARFAKDISVTDLTNTNFSGAILSLTDDQNAPAPAAILAYAILDGADFTAADLRGVDMTDTIVIGSSSTPVSFSGASLNSTNFTGSFLYYADFSTGSGSVSAEGINFTNATLVNVTFIGANLRSASTDTTFENAVVYGSQFGRSTNVENADFSNALFNEKPNALNLPEPGGGCQSVAFPGSSLKMNTDNSVICPTGNTGPCGEQWYLSKDPPKCGSDKNAHREAR
jgi:uncharacterized protein YjbI with pentapeptide repeats